MYNDLVKQLLEKHFGPAQSSLTLDKGEADPDWRDEREERVYHYVLPDMESVVKLRDLLNKQELVGGIPEFPKALTQSYPYHTPWTEDYPQCAVYREEETHWSIAFHAIHSVEYLESEAGSIEAELILRPRAIFMLTDADTESFFGIWKKLRSRKAKHNQTREGFSYWTNKALWNNRRIRGFVSDFMMEFATLEKFYILKDVARSIASCGFFLPDISFEDVLSCRTPAEVIRRLAPEGTNLNVDFNKVDLSVGYVMVKLAPHVARRDLPHLAALDTQTLSQSASLKLFYDGFTPAEFIRTYYQRRLAEGMESGTAYMYAKDYVQLCEDENLPFRFGLTGVALARLHDRLSREIRRKADAAEMALPLVTVPSRFDALENALAGTGIERIVTTPRLRDEGERQHNCVFSRRGDVRKDRIAVFHWDHGGASYTIQISCAAKKGQYVVDEMRARFNHSVTAKDLADLRLLLPKNCLAEESLTEGIPAAIADFAPADDDLADIPF